MEQSKLTTWQRVRIPRIFDYLIGIRLFHKVEVQFDRKTSR
jgi:hypothetical protein